VDFIVKLISDSYAGGFAPVSVRFIRDFICIVTVLLCVAFVTIPYLFGVVKQLGWYACDDVKHLFGSRKVVCGRVK